MEEEIAVSARKYKVDENKSKKREREEIVTSVSENRGPVREQIIGCLYLSFTGASGKWKATSGKSATWLTQSIQIVMP